MQILIFQKRIAMSFSTKPLGNGLDLTSHNDQPPFRYLPTRSFDDVSKNLVGDLVRRVFHGSREQLLVHLLQTKKLTKKEKSALRSLLEEDES